MRRVNVGPVYGILHCVASGCVADVMEEVSASIFRVEISRGSKMLRLYRVGHKVVWAVVGIER